MASISELPLFARPTSPRAISEAAHGATGRDGNDSHGDSGPSGDYPTPHLDKDGVPSLPLPNTSGFHAGRSSHRSKHSRGLELHRQVRKLEAEADPLPPPKRHGRTLSTDRQRAKPPLLRHFSGS